MATTSTLKARIALCLFVVFGLAALDLKAQISINAGKSNLEISGALYPIFNMRYVPGSASGPVYWPFSNNQNADLRNNRFEMRNIQLNLEGRYANDWEYQIQINFAKIASPDGGPDIENPPLMESSVSYVGSRHIKVKAGFQKIPYSRSSLTSYTQMPYIRRAEMVRGEVFSRRDVGVVLYNSYWNQRINLFAGMFTGQGEAALMGVNDRSGNFELVARAEVAYPSRYRNREIDDNISPVPMVVLGVNGRTNTRGNIFASDSLNYGLKNLNGTRNMWGFDVSAQYMGWSAQFEYHLMNMRPTVMADYGQGLQAYTDNFNAGGFITQLNYNCQPLRSVFSIRYDRFNSNDLVGARAGEPNYNFLSGTVTGKAYDSRSTQENITIAYNLKLNGWNSALRAQYSQPIKVDETLPGRAADPQLRLGWQYLFR